jgi:prefoldin subunit 5
VAYVKISTMMAAEVEKARATARADLEAALRIIEEELEPITTKLAQLSQELAELRSRLDRISPA